MGTQNGNVVVAGAAVQSASSGLNKLSQEQGKEKTFLEQADENLYQLWDGDAGTNFRYASYTIEVLLQGIAKRHLNTADALDETAKKFSFMDEALSENLAVYNTNPSQEGDG